MQYVEMSWDKVFKTSLAEILIWLHSEICQLTYSMGKSAVVLFKWTQTFYMLIKKKVRLFQRVTNGR